MPSFWAEMCFLCYFAMKYCVYTRLNAAWTAYQGPQKAWLWKLEENEEIWDVFEGGRMLKLGAVWNANITFTVYAACCCVQRRPGAWPYNTRYHEKFPVYRQLQLYKRAVRKFLQYDLPGSHYFLNHAKGPSTKERAALLWTYCNNGAKECQDKLAYMGKYNINNHNNQCKVLLGMLDAKTIDLAY